MDRSFRIKKPSKENRDIFMWNIRTKNINMCFKRFNSSLMSTTLWNIHFQRNFIFETTTLHCALLFGYSTIKYLDLAIKDDIIFPMTSCCTLFCQQRDKQETELLVQKGQENESVNSQRLKNVTVDADREQEMSLHPKDVVRTLHFWTLWGTFICTGLGVTFIPSLYKVKYVSFFLYHLKHNNL